MQQEHGGALLSGGKPGNKGGLGVPPSALRDHLRGSFAERIAVLEAVADGDAIQRAEIPLSSILEHAYCPTCGDQLEANPEGVPPYLISIEAKVSAAPRDRIKALDVMATYGLGALKEISAEHVRDRLRQTIDVIRQEVPELADALLAKMEPIWR